MKILYITPSATDPLAFYRGSGPLSCMRKTYSDFDFENFNEINWAMLTKFDLIFMQRPFKPEHVEIIRIAKAWGLPVAIDFDDWLFDLPESNPAYEVFKFSKENVFKACEMADVIFVATEHLKKLYEQMGFTKCLVVPNAYNSNLYPYRKDDPGRNRIVVWRGSNSHIQDVMSVANAYEALIEKHKEWQFVFIAQRPFWLKKKHENIHCIESLGILEYMKCMHDLAPSIVTHPLTDCDFNKAKSMCSWIEATHGRAAFVGCDFEEFKRPGITNYKAEDEQSFFNAIDELITKPINIINNAQESEKQIFSDLEITNVNKLRYDAFKQILK